VDTGFRHIHERGILGVSLPSLTALGALTFGTQRGLFWLAPWLLLAPVGLLELRNPERRLLTGVLAANVLLALVVASGFGYWLGGWSVGPRHLVSALPAMTVLVAFGWQRLVKMARGREGLADAVARGLVVAGIWTSAAAALTYPGFPEELRDPLAELALPLVARGQFSHSLGTALGLRSDLAMLPALLAVFAMAVWTALGAPRTRSEAAAAWWRAALAGWLALVPPALAVAVRSTPTREAVFRVAWLTQTVWEPKDVQQPFDARLAAWEVAHRAFDKGKAKPEHFRAVGAIESYRGDDDAALAAYARAAWGAPPLTDRGPP
jgi:hypothetical protein